MTPEPPDHDRAGEQTGDLSDELAPLATGAGEGAEEAWPQFEGAAVSGSAVRVPDRTARGSGDDEPDQATGGFGLSPLLLLLLLGGLAIVTFAGIVVGRAVQPAARVATTLTTTSVPVTTTTRRATPPRKPRPATTRLGPLSATAIGHFTPAVRGSAALVGSRLVVAGGVGSGRVLAGPAAGRLTQVGNLSEAWADPAVFALGGSVYILGGERGKTPTDQITRVDASSGRASSAGTFEEPLAEASVAVKAGAAYIVGGWTGQKYATAVLRYTPGAAPALVARLPQGLRSPAVAVTGNTLIVAGGLTEQGLSRQVYGVDLASGAVKPLGALPQGLERGTLVPVGAKLYLLGGSTAGGGPLAGVVQFDLATGRVTAAGTMAKPLAGAVAIRAGARTLLVDTAGGVVYRIG